MARCMGTGILWYEQERPNEFGMDFSQLFLILYFLPLSLGKISVILVLVKYCLIYCTGTNHVTFLSTISRFSQDSRIPHSRKWDTEIFEKVSISKKVSSLNEFHFPCKVYKKLAPLRQERFHCLRHWFRLILTVWFLKCGILLYNWTDDVQRFRIKFYHCWNLIDSEKSQLPVFPVSKSWISREV